MGQENKNKIDNKGCAIAIGIYIIISLVYWFCSSSKADIANNGVFFLYIAFIAATYYGIKKFLDYTRDLDNKLIRIGGSIGIFISLSVLFGALMKDINTMTVLGVYGMIAFCTFLGILIYKNLKDDNMKKKNETDKDYD